MSGSMVDVVRRCYCSMSEGEEILLCKRKGADELRISDWSSDVCSSDLVAYSARGQGSRLGVDEEFRNRAFAEPAGIVPGDRDHVGRGACDRDLARPRQ